MRKVKKAPSVPLIDAFERFPKETGKKLNSENSYLGFPKNSSKNFLNKENYEH